MEIETSVLLAYAIEDSTDIFRISRGGFEHPKPPLSVRHCFSDSTKQVPLHFIRDLDQYFNLRQTPGELRLTVGIQSNPRTFRKAVSAHFL